MLGMEINVHWGLNSPSSTTLAVYINVSLPALRAPVVIKTLFLWSHFSGIPLNLEQCPHWVNSIFSIGLRWGEAHNHSRLLILLSNFFVYLINGNTWIFIYIIIVHDIISLFLGLTFWARFEHVRQVYSFRSHARSRDPHTWTLWACANWDREHPLLRASWCSELPLLSSRIHPSIGTHLRRG